MSIVFLLLLCYSECCGEYFYLVLNRYCLWWTYVVLWWTYFLCDDGCMYRFSNFIVYMVLFYGLYFEILQYTWFFVGCSLNWNVAFVTFLSYSIDGIILWFSFRNFTIYKIQLKIYSIMWKFYSIQDSIENLQYYLKILQYTRFNFTVYKIQPSADANNSNCQ